MKKICIVGLIYVVAILAITTIILSCVMAGYHLSAKVVLDTANYDNNSDEITIVTSNLRGITTADKGQTAWYNRAPRYTKVIGTLTPDILCTQETEPTQVKYILKSIKGFDAISYKESANAVFYNTNKFKVISHSMFWVSETPDVESYAWGAACIRTCIVVNFERIKDGKQFIVLCTHLDHVSKEARTNGMKMIQSRIETFDLPCMLCGDMNAGNTSTMYSIATTNMDDSRMVALNADEDNETYHAYDAWYSGSAIDFIFLTKNTFDVDTYRIVKDTINSFYISDHYPVMAKVKFK